MTRQYRDEHGLTLRQIQARATCFGAWKHTMDVLPAIIRDMNRPVRIWAGAIQQGEELWTLAMHCLDKGLDVNIVGTDMQPIKRKVAELGDYVAFEVELNVSTGWLSQDFYERFFEAAAPGHVRVADEVRQLVTFERASKIPARVGAGDVVSLRNVWRHLSTEERATLARKLNENLPEDGVVVFADHNEFAVHRHGMRSVGPSIYAKPGGSAERYRGPETRGYDRLLKSYAIRRQMGLG